MIKILNPQMAKLISKMIGTFNAVFMDTLFDYINLSDLKKNHVTLLKPSAFD